MSVTRDNSVDRRRLNAEDRNWVNARSRAATRLGWLAYQENRPKKTTLKPSEMGGDRLTDNYAQVRLANEQLGAEARRYKALAS